jgi:hypothetical protein
MGGCCPISACDDDQVPTMRLDIKKVSLVEGVSLHDDVTVTVTGKVIAIRGPDEYVGTEYQGEGKKPKKVDRTYPGTLEIEVAGVKLLVANQFDGMDEDE